MTNRIEIGAVYRDWFDGAAHTLHLDLDAFAFLVDDGREFLALAVYLDRHPERRSRCGRVCVKGGLRQKYCDGQRGRLPASGS